MAGGQLGVEVQEELGVGGVRGWVWGTFERSFLSLSHLVRLALGRHLLGGGPGLVGVVLRAQFHEHAGVEGLHLLGALRTAASIVKVENKVPNGGGNFIFSFAGHVGGAGGAKQTTMRGQNWEIRGGGRVESENAPNFSRPGWAAVRGSAENQVRSREGEIIAPAMGSSS